MADAREKKKRLENSQPVLVCRNVTVNGRRTSLRMEPLLWDSLKDIAEREGVSINELCSEIDLRRGPANLTAALRVLIISYYRNAASKAPSGFEEEAALSLTPADSPLLRQALAEAIPLDE